MSSSGNGKPHGSQERGGSWSTARIPDSARPVTSSATGLTGEEPSMRAVAMLAPSTDVVRLGISKPLSPLKSPGRYGPSTSIPAKSGTKETSLHLNPSNWKVRDEALECMPEHFVLERTARFIGGMTASVVSARISECLRKRSVAAFYDNEKAKAKCTTADFVDFRVRLFSGRDEYSHGVIVEVQRRSGSSVFFHRECRAILDAAEDCSTEKSPSVLKRPSDMVDLFKLEDEESQHQRREEGAIRAIEVAVDLIQKDRLDANLLGLESLSALTDPTKTTPETALLASKSIVGGEENSAIRDVIASLVQCGLLPSEDDETNALEDPLHISMRNYALIVLSNALTVTSKNDCLSDAVSTQPWFVDQLIPVLIREVKDAKSNPHNAFWAVKSLNVLLSVSPAARSKAIDDGALGALSEAREYGSASHANLASETDRGVMALECQC